MAFCVPSGRLFGAKGCAVASWATLGSASSGIFREPEPCSVLFDPCAWVNRSMRMGRWFHAHGTNYEEGGKSRSRRFRTLGRAVPGVAWKRRLLWCAKGFAVLLLQEFADEVVGVAPLVDDEEHIAHVDADASLQVAVERDVARHGFPVAIEGQAQQFSLAVEHG